MKIVISNQEVREALKAQGRRVWTARQYKKVALALYAKRLNETQGKGLTKRGGKRGGR